MMTDKEKVIKGLEHCDFGDFSNCDECPYYQSHDCADELKNDILGLLKEQEPRVMTLDEITEIYVEFKGDDCPIRLTNFDLQKIVMHMVDGVCRLWTGRPTNEQRKAVKWSEGSREVPDHRGVD